jgi:hypothetical protein
VGKKSRLKPSANTAMQKWMDALLISYPQFKT